MTSDHYLWGIVAVAIVAIFWILRDRLKKLTVQKGNSRLEMEADIPAGGAVGRNLKTREGGVLIIDGTGKGAVGDGIEANSDISIENKTPPKT